MKTNVALIGFMATGKTAVAGVLAKKLGKQFVELDALIEHRGGKSIAEIFEQDGEIAFRELEIELTKEVSAKKNQVIACGGGLVLNKINIDRLKEQAVMVYLEASPEVILKRASSDNTVRPLLKGDRKAQTIRELVRFRQPYYERAADITIDTSEMDINTIAQKIIRLLQKDESLY